MSNFAAAVAWEGFPDCPCGCGNTGMKLSARTGHVVRVCSCPSCRNSRNVRKGKRAQAETHRNLGGSGFTPYHEESGRFVDLTVRPEVKGGRQIPASFHAFISTEWFRRALSQSERAIPVGIDARPAVSMNGRWLVVDIRPRKAPR